MANSLDRGLEQALSDLESDPLPEPVQDVEQLDALERSDHIHLRKVEHDVRSLKRGARRMWVAMGFMVFALAGSIALNLMT